jgi:UDP-N-acetylglucosamine--N-acetylmuramyl-(pentapeptide) pyrophosphoryl-undecaprenol N-acetylglucosamine transferase
MRIIMSGGGTGGHIYPAIAIADKIKDKRPDAEILFVGTEKGLEKTLVPKHGYQIRFVKSTGLDRKKLLKNIKALAVLRAGLKEARTIINDFKPDIVIGTGGYVCWPVLKAASEVKARVFLHEQNATPGLSNKMLEKYAEKVFIGFHEAKAGFKKQEKVVFSGNPVRERFYGEDRDDAREKLGVGSGELMIVAFGGSQGAAKINEVMAEISQTLYGLTGFAIFFVTGLRHYEGILEIFKKKNLDLNGNIRVLPYIEEMGSYLAACDLVISRAGALTIAEIIACGKPSVLIPSPNVTGNHQFFNARSLSVKGGAILIEEKDLNAEKLTKLLIEMKRDGSALLKMAEVAALENKTKAADIIYNKIFYAE